jgi:hypothetical protein
MSESLVQRIASRVDDIARRIEIGLANLEMDDVAAFCLQCLRFHQHFERSLSAKTRHSRGEPKFAGLSHHSEISIITAMAQLVF